MRFKDELRITMPDYGHSVGLKKPYCSVTDRDVIELIEKLNQTEGIAIDINECELTAEYQLDTKDAQGSTRILPIQELTAPLRTAFNKEDDIRINSYTLRGNGLEIRIENHDKVQDSGRPDLIGPLQDRDSGIVAHLVYEGRKGEELIVAVKDIVDGFYHPIKRMIEKSDIPLKEAELLAKELESEK